MESYAELKALRLEMKLSIAEMAGVMGIKKATYQGYETGRRPMPGGFINRVREWRQLDMEFMAGIAARVDERLIKEGFGRGIPSEFICEEMEL